jgi:hypothetical protein
MSSDLISVAKWILDSARQFECEMFHSPTYL